MSAPAGPPPPWEARPVRDVVRVSGPDARSFLQGQLSQDVAGLAPGEATWSFLLQPTGKVDAWLRVAAEGPEALALDVDAGWGEAVLARLGRFKLRVAADLDLEPGGRRLPTPEGPEAWEAARIAAGVPAMGAELTERTIPAEAGAWVVAASVSFTKGCFTGQELVARIDARGGHVPHPVRCVVLAGPARAAGSAQVDLPPVGAEVRVGGEVAGALTSVARRPGDGAVVALAPLARAVEPPAEAVVAWDGHEAPASVLDPPLR